MKLYFTEFEARESVAAKITHEADSLECRIQAVIYILRYPQFEKLLEFLEPLPKAVYFQDLTNLLLKEETLLREKQSPEKQPRLTIIFVIGTFIKACVILPANFIRRSWRRQRYPV
jgi:hypothetical protein